MFDTIYLSPRVNTEQIQIIEATLLRLKLSPEWRSWLAQPGVSESSRGWYFEDDDPGRRMTRTKLGANMHVGFNEIALAHARGQLAAWVIEQAYLYAAEVSKILGVQDPVRSPTFPASHLMEERPS